MEGMLLFPPSRHYVGPGQGQYDKVWILFPSGWLVDLKTGDTVSAKAYWFMSEFHGDFFVKQSFYGDIRVFESYFYREQTYNYLFIGGIKQCNNANVW